MNKKAAPSIKKSILSAVLVGFLILSTILVAALSVFEMDSLNRQVESLVREQISLIANNLDRFRDIQQVDYLTKSAFDLEEVEGVIVYDTNCSVLKRQPLNYAVDWNCQDERDFQSTMFIRLNSPLSSSVGYPKYVVIKLRKVGIELLNYRTLSMILITLLSVLGTIFYIIYKLKIGMLEPLEQIRAVISSKVDLLQYDSEHEHAPIELRPIYRGIRERNIFIKESKAELLRQQEAVTTAKISQQVAHDIKSPIVVLRDLLVNRGSKTNNFQDEIYQKALNELESLTKQLLESTSDFKKDLDIHEIVKDVIDMKKIAFRAFADRVSINYSSPSVGQKIFVNETRIKSLISNLINNASEAIPQDRNGAIDVSIIYENETCKISVKDNGVGVPDDLLGVIFNRGVSIGKTGGYGLGLSSAREYMESIGGKVLIKSEVGKYTEVTLLIPIVESCFMSNGVPFYDFVFIEDFKLIQYIWLEEAKRLGLNFIIFSSPSEFESNIGLVSPNAQIYIDSFFPGCSIKGEDWARTLFDLGFKNLWMCSTDKIDISDKPWICGSVPKERPFSNIFSLDHLALQI